MRNYDSIHQKNTPQRADRRGQPRPGVETRRREYPLPGRRAQRKPRTHGIRPPVRTPDVPRNAHRGEFRPSGADGFGQGSHFGGFGQRGGFHGGQFRQKGSDIHADVTVSFDDAAFGCEKMIHLKDENGQVQSLKVTIPAGIDTGKTVRLKGKGNPGFNGGEAGDLLLKVKVGDRAGFERKGMDVYTNISIPFTTAVLGGEAVVPTLNGNVICKIRPGTQSGSKIRLKGKGIVSMKDRSVHGDEYAVVQIQVPKNLNETAKEKLKEFAKAC